MNACRIYNIYNLFNKVTLIFSLLLILISFCSIVFISWSDESFLAPDVTTTRVTKFAYLISAGVDEVVVILSDLSSTV